jgi:uncharacterized protein YabE (DUF348 family)
MAHSSHVWSPKKFSKRRRLRILIAALVVIICVAAYFFIGIRKTVALTVNGVTREVQTYALSVDRLLAEQGVHVQTHDQVISSSRGWLTNDDTVTVRKAYQVTLNIDGKLIPYWTVAKSASQLLGFFNQSVDEASKITVDITNVYNELTGGLVIDQAGPVLVIWDGKQSIAPDGNIPVASILDSKAITLGKNDRVQIEKAKKTVDGVSVSTIMRVQRVTTKNMTRNVPVPFTSIKVNDPTATQGTTKVTQKGVDGVKTETLLVTLVDGVEESERVLSSQVTKQPTEEIISVGTKPKPKAPAKEPAKKSTQQPKNTSKPKADSPNNPSNSDNSGDKSNTDTSDDSKGDSGSSTPPKTPKPPATPPTKPPTTPTTPPTTPPSDGGSVLHLTPSEAQSLAQGMMKDFYGWGSDQFSCLVTMWNRESGWRWNAENPSGAYGIPQALPGSKMGTGWHDDASVQISWGLGYIANRYSTPCNAWSIWQTQGWY